MKEAINNMAIEDFMKLPYRKWDDQIVCDCIIILPTSEIHDSGFRCIDVVAVKDGEPICRSGGSSDTIHIEGIAGNGFKWLERCGEEPKSLPPVAWTIDCLAKSGLLCLWPIHKSIIIYPAVSSLEIFSLARISHGSQNSDKK